MWRFPAGVEPEALPQRRRRRVDHVCSQLSEHREAGATQVH